jgi:hypothetical protein
MKRNEAQSAFNTYEKQKAPKPSGDGALRLERATRIELATFSLGNLSSIYPPWPIYSGQA